MPQILIGTTQRPWYFDNRRGSSEKNIKRSRKTMAVPFEKTKHGRIHRTCVQLNSIQEGPHSHVTYIGKSNLSKKILPVHRSTVVAWRMNPPEASRCRFVLLKQNVCECSSLKKNQLSKLNTYCHENQSQSASQVQSSCSSPGQDYLRLSLREMRNVMLLTSSVCLVT